MTDERVAQRGPGRAAHARPRRPRRAARRAAGWRCAGRSGRRSTRSRSGTHLRGDGARASSPPSARPGAGRRGRVSRPARAAGQPVAPADGRSTRCRPVRGGARPPRAPSYRMVGTRGTSTPREEARARPPARRDRGGRGRRRPARPARRRAARHTEPRSRSSPAAAATTSRACSAIPTRPAPRPRGIAVEGEERPIDVGVGRRQAVRRHRQLRLRLRRQPHRQRGPLVQGQPRLHLRRAARAAQLAARALPGHGRRRAPRRDRLLRGGRQLEGVRRRDVRRARRPSSTTASSTWCSSEHVRRAVPSRTLPKVFKGTHVDDPAIRRPDAASEIEVDADRPFDDLRRRRPDRRPARHDQVVAAAAARDRPATPDAPRSSCIARAARVRALSRRAGRRAAPPLPGRCCCGSTRARSAGWRGGSSAARCSSPPPTARPPPRRCSPRSSSARPARVVHNRAGSNMHWGVATALLDAGAARRRARPVRGRRGLAADGGRRELDPRSSCSATSSATSSTATASSSCSPTAGRTWWRARDGRTRVRPERRRPAGRRPRPRARAASSTSAWRTTRRRCPSSSTPPTRSTAATAAPPYVYEAVYLGHLGHYRCPSCGRERPAPEVVAAERVELHGMSGSDVAHRARPRARSS